LTEKMADIEILAKKLLEKEVLREEDLVEILGPRMNAKPADYDAFVGRFDSDRKERTGKSDGDGKAKDGAHTPPIPGRLTTGLVAKNISQN